MKHIFILFFIALVGCDNSAKPSVQEGNQPALPQLTPKDIATFQGIITCLIELPEGTTSTNGIGFYAKDEEGTRIKIHSGYWSSKIFDNNRFLKLLLKKENEQTFKYMIIGKDGSFSGELDLDVADSTGTSHLSSSAVKTNEPIVTFLTDNRIQLYFEIK